MHVIRHAHHCCGSCCSLSLLAVPALVLAVWLVVRYV